MAPRTDHTARIPSGVAFPVATNHAAKGFMFVNLRNAGNLKNGLVTWNSRWMRWSSARKFVDFVGPINGITCARDARLKCSKDSCIGL